jgi:Cu/Ag efflux protein CusF
MRKLIAAAAIAVLPFAARADKAPESAEGVVRALYPGEAAILIAHGEIRSLAMGPMTMEFVLADPALARGLKVGDRVLFVAIKRGDEYVITALRKRDRDP